MSSQLGPLLRNEISKAVRRKLPYFGIFAMGLGSLISYFLAGQLNNASTTNGWSYVAFSMQLVFSDLGPIFIVVFASMSLADETGNGTIRALLAAPVQRWELYLAKATVSVLYMLILSAATLLFSIALGHIHHNFAAVGDTFGVVYTRERAIQAFLLGYVLSWIPLAALVMCGLFISTIIPSPGAAVATGISTLVISDFVKHLVGLDPYIFTKYINYSWLNLGQLAQGMDYQWQPEVWKMAALCAVYGVAAFGGGLVYFVRKDLNH
jgi:ABC-type transport system involved in multi-copper enzyme maturation permease subunit